MGNNVLSKIIACLRNQCRKFLIDYYPQIVINYIWERKYGHKIDWNNPVDLNEKIQWLICFGDTSKWSDLADKYKVRMYIQEKGYSYLLPKLLGVWKDANDINYDILPDKFVLKCNHDSGSTRVIDKKMGINIVELSNYYNCCLKHKYGYGQCEPHYNKIKPVIIAEEFLDSGNSNHNLGIIDYKVWCFDGKPYCIFVVHNRTHDHIYCNVYDLNWNVHPEWSNFSNYHRDGENKVPKPVKLAEMIKIAADLSKGFPQVRVDFYIINNKIYFGEMTFTSACGRMDCFSEDFLKEMGDKVIL